MDKSTDNTSTEQNATGTENFNPITTQADLDRILGDRLARERAKFGDYEELKTKASKLDELEEAQKTELQKLTERAEAAEAKATAYEAENQVRTWKQQVSEETGIPANVLAGTTLEELKAHAEQLAPLLAPPTQGARTIIHEREPQQGALPLNSDELTESALKLLGL